MWMKKCSSLKSFVRLTKINKAVADLHRKKDHIANLEADVSHYRLMEEEFHTFKARYQTEVQKNEELSQVKSVLLGSR